MARHRSGFRRLLAAGALAGCLGAGAVAVPLAAAPTAAPVPMSDERVAAMADDLAGMLAHSFQLDPALKLDPGLRAEADRMSAAHLERMRRLLPDWVRDEQRLEAAENVKQPPNSVYYAVWARLLNELALWQLEPGDPAYEQATLEVLKASPRVCEAEGNGRFIDFTTRVMRLQAMAPAQRQAALATERDLLAHWGQPRAAVPAWPDPLPQQAGMALVARMRVEGPTPAQALPPMLASELLAGRRDYDELPWETRCRFQQWWLRVSLAQGTAPAAALEAYRFGTMLTAMTRLGSGFDEQHPEQVAKTAAEAEAKGLPAYPLLASYFDVKGKTTVRRRLDAGGKPVQASVVKRDITVRGIRGVRPVAFETTFDALSVKYGLTAQVAAKPDADNSQLFQMVWMLDPAKPAAPAADKQGGAR